jgi:hypothetical protein
MFTSDAQNHMFTVFYVDGDESGGCCFSSENAGDVELHTLMWSFELRKKNPH